jgi:hypothetical protein
MITIIKDKIEITELQIFALMLASLIHDVDHPGNNNIFEINSRSKLALIYNDISILENHHCSIGFKIMCMNSIQLLKNLSKNDYNEVREIIIFSILATDMIFHQELINKLEKNNTWNYKLICKMIIHAADLSNQIRPFEILKEGSENLRIEYINQKNNETIIREIDSMDPMFSNFIKDPTYQVVSINFNSGDVEKQITEGEKQIPGLKTFVNL